MQAIENTLLKFLEGTKQFHIPIFQRHYSWEKQHCQQLWDDILRAGQDPSIQSHFIGPVVYVEEKPHQVSGVSEFFVIDGQQRLTTFMLLIAALGKAMETTSHDIAPNMTAAKLRKYYFNNDEDGNLKYKLLLNNSDSPTLTRILDDKPLPNTHASCIAENYEFFCDLIDKTSVDIGVIYEGIAKIYMIDMSLDRDRDDPQLIFESLNSTGKELSQADLIRNYILMGLDVRQQETLFDDYWGEIEEMFDHGKDVKRFDRFMRHYLVIKTGKILKKDSVYRVFKTYLRKESYLEITKNVEDIRTFVEHFACLALGNEENIELNRVIQNINTLKTDVAYPFLMQVYNDYRNNVIDIKQIIKVFRIVECYVLRRSTCGMYANALSKVFANLYKKIDPDAYVESIQATLIMNNGYQRFPTDEEFKAAFMTKDIYNLRIKYYLFEKLENFDSKERVAIDDYTIEHIMPQNENMPNEWRTEIGVDWPLVYDKYLHTIGNLTLTGYNSELSDRVFTKKRDMKGGFGDSPLRLNRDLAKLDKWNEYEITKRAEMLATRAIAIWPRPILQKAVVDKYRRETTADDCETEEYETEE